MSELESVYVLNWVSPSYTGEEPEVDLLGIYTTLDEAREVGRQYYEYSSWSEVKILKTKLNRKFNVNEKKITEEIDLFADSVSKEESKKKRDEKQKKEEEEDKERAKKYNENLRLKEIEDLETKLKDLKYKT